MSIYQAKRSKTPLVLGAVAMAIVGLSAGWLLWGRAEPDPIEALTPTREALAGAAASIDVVVAHAQFAADEGQDPPDYAGSVEAIEGARAAFEDVAATVDAIVPGTGAAIRADLDSLADLIEGGAPPAEVIEVAEALAGELRDALGP
jgi:hypothetical protein